MTVSVVVPTYRRTQDFCRCLQSLKRQIRSADEVLAVVRDTDRETHNFLAGFDAECLPLRIVGVTRAGQVAALNAGLEAATGDIIAITDDDAAPHADWLLRIEDHFNADIYVGGVGGRDWQLIERGSRQVVGKVQWFGRVIGNHHLGVGLPREVDVLKGANMSYRREAVGDKRFDVRLRGEGAQVHNDLAFSLAVRQAGWKLIYDPAVAIDHFIAPRFDADQNLRGIFNAEGIRNAAYNETLILLSALPPLRRTAFLFWAFLIGTRGQPGLMQVPRLMILRDRNIKQRTGATYAGRFAGLVDSLRPSKSVDGVRE